MKRNFLPLIVSLGAIGLASCDKHVWEDKTVNGKTQKGVKRLFLDAHKEKAANEKAAKAEGKGGESEKKDK